MMSRNALLNLAFGAGAALSLSVALYAFLGRADMAPTMMNILVFLVIPALGCIGFTALMMSPLRVKKNAMLVACSLVVGAYGIELVCFAYMSITAPQRARGWVSRMAVVKEDLEAVRVPAFSAIGAYQLSTNSYWLELGEKRTDRIAEEIVRRIGVLPLAGISNVVTLMCEEHEGFVAYQSDEHGFRNPRRIWSAAAIDIVAIGDSLTQGSCVADDNTMLGVIRKAYSLTLNLAYAGNGPLAELGTIAEYVPHLKPRIVLWFFGENDFSGLANWEKNSVLRRYVDDPGFSQDLIFRQEDIDEILIEVSDAAYQLALKKIAHWEDHIRTFRPIDLLLLRSSRTLTGLIYGKEYRKDRWKCASTEDSDIAIEDRDLFAKILRTAKGIVEENNGQLIFVYIPTSSVRSGHESVQQIHRYAVSAAREVGLGIVDILELIDSKGPERYEFGRRLWSSKPEGRKFGHYSSEGYGIAAREVLRYLHSNALLSRRAPP